MARAKKSDCAGCKQKSVVFPERACFRIDPDVRAMLNASGQAVDWANMAHAFNAGLRQAFMPWKPEDLQVVVSPFEQLVFARKIVCLRKKKK